MGRQISKDMCVLSGAYFVDYILFHILLYKLLNS